MAGTLHPPHSSDATPLCWQTSGMTNWFVCVSDKTILLWVTRPARPFSLLERSPTPFMEGVLKFMHDFQAETVRSRDFVEQIVELDLLAVSARAKLKGGQSYQLGGFSVINEAKLRALDKEVVNKLFRKGWLSLIDAHLLSLGSLAPLNRAAWRTRPRKLPDLMNMARRGITCPTTTSNQPRGPAMLFALFLLHRRSRGSHPALHGCSSR